MRKETRQPVSRSGRIETEEGQNLACRITDISTGGALLLIIRWRMAAEAIRACRYLPRYEAGGSGHLGCARKSGVKYIGGNRTTRKERQDSANASEDGWSGYFASSNKKAPALGEHRGLGRVRPVRRASASPRSMARDAYHSVQGSVCKPSPCVVRLASLPE